MANVHYISMDICRTTDDDQLTQILWLC